MGAVVGYTWNVDRTQHVVYISNSDRTIQELYFHQSHGWVKRNLSDVADEAPPGGPDYMLTAYTWGVDNTQHIVYRGLHGEIHELYFHQSADWKYNNLSAKARTPRRALEMGPQGGYTWDKNKTQHIVYADVNHHICELCFHQSLDWQYRNLTAATKAPPCRGAPSGYTYDLDKSQHVVYFGDDGRIHELVNFYQSPTWLHFDLTESAGLPAEAVPDGFCPAGYTWDVDNTQHVVCRMANGHIYELYFHPSLGWNYKVLTAVVTGADRTNEDPAAYTWNVDKTQHIVYKGLDSHIHELYFHQDLGWSHTDLTEKTKTHDLKVSKPRGYTWDVDNTQHVVYMDIDEHIHELYFHPNQGWNHAQLS